MPQVIVFVFRSEVKFRKAEGSGIEPGVFYQVGAKVFRCDGSSNYFFPVVFVVRCIAVEVGDFRIHRVFIMELFFRVEG